MLRPLQNRKSTLARRGVIHRALPWFELGLVGQLAQIPPYLEIEGDSRGHVVEVAGALGIDESRLTGENTIKVFARYGIDLTTIGTLRFD